MSYSRFMVYSSLAALIIGGCVPPWLISHHWFMEMRPSPWNPLTWIKLGGLVGGILLGGVNEQSQVGACIGSALIAAAILFLVFNGLYLLVRKQSRVERRSIRR